MLDDYKKYIDSTPVRKISLRSFMRTFKDIRDKEQLLGYWTGKVLPYLRHHSALDKRQLGFSLKKATVNELRAIIDEEPETRGHISALLPNVARQKQAVSNLHTARIEESCYIAAPMQQENESHQQQSTRPSTAASTTPPGSPSQLVLTAAVPAASQAPVMTPFEEAEPVITKPVIDNDEREVLLRSVEKASHTQCDWVADDICVVCRFQAFQRACIDALVQSEIKKTEVADAMAIIGVFAPSMPTARMKNAFTEGLLRKIAKSTIELPDTDFDDSLMMKTVRADIHKIGNGDVNGLKRSWGYKDLKNAKKRLQ
ncbi:hypothetical protein BC939DRAFT_528526 [Gamsiella multidivaricata]|uniref:uncharacterized protein n=1 Tax=Gamsiella multidivaricata TaxID=101098 RepID=UPI00221FD60E|nr:uncharacterized protein BC939DRAFT_528526 [Gamsiella multidivaricata]KAI7824324.1 hypothetical protein BC939DRAFT_528526 [Gamsiella multidivaricata]